jgi:2-oxoglutarate ferredoxin oxidoreductase subunit alpha
VDVHSHTKVAGMAFKAEELQNLFSEIITSVTTEAAK